MPVHPLIPAILGTIIDSAGERLLNPPAPEIPKIGIVRTLPAESRVGEMLPPWQGQVQIDGKLYLFSPGAQIRNELNIIILPTMVQAPTKVRYQTDMLGAVHRVWVLSASEASLPENR